MLTAVTDRKRIEQLEAALRGVLSYVKVSNPRSLSPRDVEAKELAILVGEAALNPPPPDAVDIPAQPVEKPIAHPLNEKMGVVVG